MNVRKQQVLLTAQRLFVERGFSTTSVQDILEESGISKGTFYNYFSSKNECLMAILEHAKDVSTFKRRKLLVGQDISNPNVLTEQIAVQLQVNHEQNMLSLFEAIFHSGEQELRDFVKKHFTDELLWLTQRIIDIYGKDIAPHAFDCAIMLIGMLQNITHIWISHFNNALDTSKPIRFVMRRMDAIVADLIHTNDILLNKDMISKKETEQRVYSRLELLTQLTGFYKGLESPSPQGKQYAQFLIDELKLEHPRVYLIETISQSFTEAFVGTYDESGACEIASRLWKYIDTIGKKDK